MKYSNRVYGLLCAVFILLTLYHFPQAAYAASDVRDDSHFIVKVTGGKDIVAALARDGTVWVWGERSIGQDTKWEKPNYDPRIAPELSGIIDVQAGNNHFLALKKDGTVWMMGSNDNGQRGDDTYTTYDYSKGEDSKTVVQDLGAYKPVQVPGLVDIVGIAATSRGGKAWDKKGRLWEWGDFEYNPSLKVQGIEERKKLSPKLIEDVRDVVEYSYGFGVEAILKKDGTVAVNSMNQLGQWGNGSRITDILRYGQYITVPDVSDVAHIETPGLVGTVIAYRNDGTVWEWGGALLRPEGILPKDSFIDMFKIPVNITPNQTLELQEYKNISVLGAEVLGRPTLLGLKKDGTVWSRGDNYYKLLGNSAEKERYSWGQVRGLPSISQISARYLTAYAVGQDGSIWGWGLSNPGLLGDAKESYPGNYYGILQATPIPIGDFKGSAVSVTVKGTVVVFLPSPENRNGSLVVNLEDAVTWFGAKAAVDNKKKTVTIAKKKTNVLIKAGSTTAVINKKTVKLTKAPLLRDGTWTILASDLAKLLGAKAEYSSIEKTLKIV